MQFCVGKPTVPVTVQSTKHRQVNDPRNGEKITFRLGEECVKVPFHDISAADESLASV